MASMREGESYSQGEGEARLVPGRGKEEDCTE